LRDFIPLVAPAGEDPVVCKLARNARHGRGSRGAIVDARCEDDAIGRDVEDVELRKPARAHVVDPAGHGAIDAQRTRHRRRRRELACKPCMDGSKHAGRDHATIVASLRRPAPLRTPPRFLHSPAMESVKLPRLYLQKMCRTRDPT
jgi:hypothetical protein